MFVRLFVSIFVCVHVNVPYSIAYNLSLSHLLTDSLTHSLTLLSLSHSLTHLSLSPLPLLSSSLTLTLTFTLTLPHSLVLSLPVPSPASPRPTLTAHWLLRRRLHVPDHQNQDDNIAPAGRRKLHLSGSRRLPTRGFRPEASHQSIKPVGRRRERNWREVKKRLPTWGFSLVHKACWKPERNWREMKQSGYIDG